MPVTLNRHKFKTVHVSARDTAETAMDLLDTLVGGAAQQLAQDVLLDIMSVTVFVVLEGPALIELDGTSACRINLVAGEYS